MLNFVTNRLQNKLILAFVLVLLIPTIIIGVYAIVSETNQLIEVYRTDELGFVQSEVEIVNNEVTDAKNGLLLLAQSPVTTHYIEGLGIGAGDITYKATFQIPLFAAFLKNSPDGIYKDIRILDKTGQEIVRVDASSGSPVVIADNELENKADRPYFAEAIKLPNGQIYTSDLDLNTTKGQIDTPYVPVIRFATPLYTQNGTLVGVMILKAFANTLLAPIVADDPGEHTVLFDTEGTYWLHPDSSKLFGPLANNNANIKLDQPADTQTFRSSDSDALVGTKDRPELAQTYVHVTLPGESTPRWTIVHQQPIGNVLDEIDSVRNALIAFAAISLLIAVGIALFVTRGIVRPVVKLSDAAKEISQGHLDAQLPALNSQDEIGQLTSAFSTMTKDLKTSYDNLERRATELQTVATVSADAASILDLDKLLQTVSDLTKANFGLYHAHIYLLDQRGATLTLQAGAGEPGRIMKEQGRQIALNNQASLVARAGRDLQGVIVNDVTQTADFLPNPLLPDTRSEVAIPMIVAGRLVGVLDVQSDRVDHFSEADVKVMTTLATQIAVAVENARAFSRVQAAQAETQRMFDVSVDMVAVATFDGYFLGVNPAWERVLGYSAKELTSQPYMNFVHSDDVEKTNALVADQLSAGRATLSFENRYRAKDGSYHWMSWNAVPVLEEGKIYCVTRDVTEAKQIAEDVQRSAVELATVAEVSTAASTILDANLLLQTVSDLTKANFNLYHAHIYLLDDAGENLELAAGAGEPGRIMKEQGRQIAIDNAGSLVARVARTHNGLVVNDVTQAVDFLPNPLLPNTRAEMAVPMLVADRLIGVLDVQSDTLNRFTEGDVRVLTTLAAQVAVAVQNARAFTETETARNLAEVVAATNETMSRADDELDILRPIFDLAPKENLLRASLAKVETDSDNQPLALDIVAGFTQDGSPLDVSVYGAGMTHLSLDQFRLLQIVIDHPDEPTVISNVFTDPRVDKAMQEWATKVKIVAAILLPLKSSNEWHGVIALSYSVPQHFAPELQGILHNVMPTAASVMKARHAYLQEEAGRQQAEIIGDTNAALSRSVTEVDILQPLYELAPKEGMLFATLSYIVTDAENKPEYLDIAAGVMPDGSPLDLSIFPSTHLPAEAFPMINVLFENPDVPTLMGNAMTDPRSDDNLRAFIQQSGVGAMIILPLKTGDIVHGLASVSYAAPLTFPADLNEILLKVMPTAGSVLSARHAYLQERIALHETERRAVELQTVAKVSAAVATNLNKEELLQNVTELVKSNFDLYHAHIYLLDETGETLTLQAGAGEPGRIMKEQGRHITIDNPGSLVARAGRTRQGVISNDVTQAADFLPNPLLPNTRAEMAVPMVIGDTLVGVLDVQSDTVDRFTDSDAQVLTMLGDQIAVAVQNAQLYEQQVETAEQLRTVDRLKSEFLASMSHELRTPLNSVIGYSRMLLDSADEEFSEDTVEDLSAIHNGGRHLLSLINDILDLAKIEADKMELDQDSVKIENVAHEVSQMTSVLLKDKPVALVLDIPANLPALWADHVRLRQVLNNLVSNAIKFTEQGQVTISAEYENNANYLTISVSDTGIGIPTEKLNLIFERFTQVDSSSARRAGGTGLGLTITKHLIEMHGGRIWANSIEGEGSMFSFTIPLATEIEMSAK